MRKQSASLVTVLLGALAAPSFVFAGEAVTYTGTIGKLPVIVELEVPGAGQSFVGRYSYMTKASKGGDIPLHGTHAKGAMKLGEEKPCTQELCTKGEYEVAEKAPLGPEWSLTASADGKTLIGSWRDGKKQLPVKLERKAARELPDMDGFDKLDPFFAPVREGDLSVVSERDLPYDFLKLSDPFREGEVHTLGDGAYRMDFDPRSELEYPMVVRLGDADPSTLNAYLRQQRLQFSLAAYGCRSRAYLGFGWIPIGVSDSNGYDGSNVTIDYLSPRLMAMTEGGSYFCGGAHPNNFVTHRLVDAKTGKPFAPESILRGWVARNAEGAVVDPATVDNTSLLTYGPDDELLKFVLDRITAPPPASDDDCDLRDLAKTNLGVYVAGEHLIFNLKDLPHAIFACGDDLVKVPLKDARPLLTEAGAKYFRELDQQ